MALPIGLATAHAAGLLFAAACVTANVGKADTPAPGEAWRTSPFHGVPNAATGRNIPCVCVYRGREYRLGDAVCMTTHVGTVVTRCDLNLNNTTWAPTTEPCNLSSRPAPLPRFSERFTSRFACAPAALRSSPPA
jgi:hypothetical protein